MPSITIENPLNEGTEAEVEFNYNPGRSFRDPEMEPEAEEVDIEFIWDANGDDILPKLTKEQVEDVAGQCFKYARKHFR